MYCGATSLWRTRALFLTYSAEHVLSALIIKIISGRSRSKTDKSRYYPGTPGTIVPQTQAQ